MSRIILAVMWLMHWLPFRALAAIGNGIGTALYWLIPERRRVTRINLQKCFPTLGDAERERLAKSAFKAFCRGFVDRAVLWWAPAERIKRMVRLEGLEHLEAAGPRVVLLGPHFAGVEAGGTRLSIDLDMSTLYQHQKDPVLDRHLLKARTRFRPNDRIVSRQQGLRKVLRWINAGIPFYYLPDLDFGRKGTVFVPFFGVPASTVAVLPGFLRDTGASMVTFWTRRDDAGVYHVRIAPAWDGWPHGDDTADAARYMAELEALVRDAPEQYLWVHKRFKTRPAGEPSLY